jgi:hypothetical protein
VEDRQGGKVGDLENLPNKYKNIKTLTLGRLRFVKKIANSLSLAIFPVFWRSSP